MTTEGFPGAPGHTLRIRRAAGGAPDVRAPRGSQRSPMNPVRRTGDPSAGQGLYWTLPLPFRDRMPGSRTHANRTLSESYRGLSKPAGVHLNFALGLSNEVGPPHSSTTCAFSFGRACTSVSPCPPPSRLPGPTLSSLAPGGQLHNSGVFKIRGSYPFCSFELLARGRCPGESNERSAVLASDCQNRPFSKLVESRFHIRCRSTPAFCDNNRLSIERGHALLLMSVI